MIRPIASAMMALTGSFFFSVFVAQEIQALPDADLGQLPWALITRYVSAMALGGAVIGALFCGLFGRAGLGGWILALFTGLLAASDSGLFGSAIGALPDLMATGWNATALIPVLSGFLVLPFALAEQPMLAIVLFVMVSLTHVFIRNRRRAHHVA